MSQATLLPCPFCGTAAQDQIAFHKWIVYCPDAEVGIGCPVMCETVGFSTREEAVAAWNTRAPHPAVAALLAVEKLFATPGYYVGTRDGADPLAIDATFALVARAVKAAKGE